MQDMIGRGAAWFRAQAREHLSVIVQYRAVGSLVPRDIPATITTTRHETLDQTGQLVRIESRDFFIHLEDYAAPPKKGDRVYAEGNVYEVFAPTGTNSWVWADRQQKIRKVHTQLVP